MLADPLASGTALFRRGVLAVDASAHLIISPVKTSTPSPSRIPGLAGIVNSRSSLVTLCDATSFCINCLSVKHHSNDDGRTFIAVGDGERDRIGVLSG